MAPSRSFFGPLLFLLLTGLSVVLYLRANVDSYATTIVESKLNEILAFGGFAADVRKANVIPGNGLEIRGLEIFDSENWAKPILVIDSVMVRFPTDVSGLIAGSTRINAIDLNRVELRVSEDHFNEEWLDRIHNVIEHKPKNELVPIRVRDSAIEFTLPSRKTSLEFNDIQLDAIPVNGPRKIIAITINAKNQHFREVQSKGGINLESGSWQFDFSRCSIALSDSLLDVLPNSLSEKAQLIQGLSGLVSLTGGVAKTGDSALPKFDLQGKLNRLNIHNNNLPTRIENGSATFRINNSQIVVENARGKIGEGTFDFGYRQNGLFEPKQWLVSGTAESIELNARLESWLNQGCRKFCRDFSPSGKFDIQFELDSTGHKDLTAQLTDMSFSFHKFSYRFNHCVGTVKWLDDDLNFRAQTIEKNQLIQFSGRVRNPGKNSTFVFKFGTDGRLPIDEPLVIALSKYPTLEQSFRDMRPAGYVSGQGQIIKSNPQSSLTVRNIQVKFHGCNVRHKKFDYPIHNVNGSVQITNEGAQFEGFSGQTGSSSVLCDGYWNRTDGLQLVFNCNQVQLDDRLRLALAPSIQSVWDQLRPTGKVNFAKVILDLPLGAKSADVRLQANLGDQRSASTSEFVSVYPVGFPYRINRIQGETEIGGGTVNLRNFLGKHDKTWLSCNGSGIYNESQWSFRLTNMLAGSVVADEDLLAALPSDLSQAITRLSYRGQMNLSGEIGFRSNNASQFDSPSQSNVHQVAYHEESAPVDIDWDLRLDIDQGNMDVGLPLENIFGAVKLKGRNTGDKVECQGQVSVDSLTIYGMQVTNVQGPLWIDDLQTQAGKFAKTILDEPRSLVGNFCDGKITFDGWVSHANNYPFVLQTTVDQTKLEQVAANFGANFQELSGDGYGFLKMQGNANELHTYSGDGSVHLRNAKIHQLPVILSLLKILNIKEVNRTAFDSSNVDFSIKGNQLKLDRIELIGDAISLIGNGYLELIRHVDVNFYSVVGRNRLYIPLLSELYKAGSQRIMWINIGGPFDNLQTSRKVLPGLDDSLRALLGAGESGTREGR